MGANDLSAHLSLIHAVILFSCIRNFAIWISFRLCIFTFVILSFASLGLVCFSRPGLAPLLLWSGLGSCRSVGHWDNFALIISTPSPWNTRITSPMLHTKLNTHTPFNCSVENERLFVILWRIPIHRKEIYIYPCVCLSCIRMLFHLYYCYYYFLERTKRLKMKY